MGISFLLRGENVVWEKLESFFRRLKRRKEIYFRATKTQGDENVSYESGGSVQTGKGVGNEAEGRKKLVALGADGCLSST